MKVILRNKALFLTVLPLLILSCCSPRKMEIRQVSRKESDLNNDPTKHIVRDYYVVKNYKRDLAHTHIIDSVALAAGRVYKFRNYYYSINFFKGSNSLENDSLIFNKSDSLTLAYKRENLFNYLFWGKIFRNRQTIKNGKVMPITTKVSIIKKDSLKIDFEPVQ